jgi:hypothetical protein
MSRTVNRTGVVALDPERRARVRRTALILALVAFALYSGFILMSVFHAR